MEKAFHGEILQGRVDQNHKELIITSVKNIGTQSVWTESQLNEMYEETQKALDDNHESLVITLRDSIPLMLDQQEIQILNKEIRAIKSDFNG